MYYYMLYINRDVCINKIYHHKLNYSIGYVILKKKDASVLRCKLTFFFHTLSCLSLNINLIFFFLVMCISCSWLKQRMRGKRPFYKDFKSYFKPLIKKKNNVHESWFKNWLRIMTAMITHYITGSFNISSTHWPWT